MINSERRKHPTSGTTRPRRRTRGGQGGAEPGLRIQRREREVLELTTTGLDQYAVAGRLGITQSAVSQILTRVDQRWATENLAYVHRQKAAAARTAMLFSRTNTLLSIPMLFAMVSAQNLY